MKTLALAGLLLLAAGQPPMASLAGRVTERSTGRPVPRMVVALVASDRTKAAEALTDADGRYVFPAVAPGRYAVTVAHDEHRSTYLPQWFGEPEPAGRLAVPSRFDIELKPGDRRTDIDVALTRALAIEGRVIDPWGDPLPASEVLVWRADSRGLPAGNAFSDDQGGYRVFGLSPGRYRVCVTAGNAFGQSATADGSSVVRTCYPDAVVEANASDVSVIAADATGIDVRIQRVGSRTIRGTVVDAAGLPVDRAFVTALAYEESGGNGNTTTHAGAFTMGGLAPGRYAVEVSAGGTPPGDPNPPARERERGFAAVDVEVTDSTHVAVALSKAITLRGRVVFEGGPPPAPATLQMTIHAGAADASRLSAVGLRHP